MAEQAQASQSIPEFNKAVCEALGFDPETVSRLVLVLDADDIEPQVYIKGPVLLPVENDLVRVLKMGGKVAEYHRVDDVQVDDNGNVFVVEKAKEDGGPQTNP